MAARLLGRQAWQRQATIYRAGRMVQYPASVSRSSSSTPSRGKLLLSGLTLAAAIPTASLLCEGKESDFRYQPSPHIKHQLRFTEDGSSRNGHDYPTGTTSATTKEPTTVSVYDLSFGTAAGLCTGLFVRKLGQAIAIVLGGAFVFLQYCRSKGIVTVNWQALSKKYGNLFTSKPASPGKYANEQGEKEGTVNIARAWNWLVDFLLADFQFRASFIPGFVLGLRMG